VRETVSYDRIKGTVASLLFLFAGIENEARQILASANQAKGLAKLHGAGAILKAWKNLLEVQRITRPEEAKLAACLWGMIQGPLAVRNGVCHGLIGASSEHDGAPATLNWRGKCGVESMTYDELQEMFAWLSRVPQAMAMASHAVLSKDPSTLQPFPKREFWESEFRIKYDSSV
jgi:hypothetical protein